jgi:hypothetical protein
MKSTRTLLVACLTAFLSPLCADELRLKDGRVLVGSVTAQGNTLEIATRDGVVRVSLNEVESRRTTADLQQTLKALASRAGTTQFAHLQLAMQARAYGLIDELWQHLGLLAEMPAAGEPNAQRASQNDFLAQLEPELLPRKFRAAKTTVRVHELLQQLDQRADAAKGKRLALLELLHREPEAEKDLRIEARRNNDAGRRLLALDALLLRNATGADSFMWRTAILDPNGLVRAEAIRTARDAGRIGGAVLYLAPGLLHGSAEVRVRTAEAFANLGDPAAMILLVKAGPNADKALAVATDGVRANIAILEQRAYVRDFDVEVAQASIIADPQVDVLQSGMVLDVTAFGVFEQQVRIVRAFQSALQRIAKADPGPDPRSWPAFLAQIQQAAELPPATTTPKAPTKKH